MQRTFAQKAGAVGLNINVDINVETVCGPASMLWPNTTHNDGVRWFVIARTRACRTAFLKTGWAPRFAAQRLPLAAPLRRFRGIQVLLLKQHGSVN